jgi:hypothetical protein
MSGEKTFQAGEKVVFIPDGKTYDFGYYSDSPGGCVIYEEGERNMQDSYAVALGDIKPASASGAPRRLHREEAAN